MPSTMSGGSELIILKKLNGAAFVSPFIDSDVTHAMGRGVIAALISL